MKKTSRRKFIATTGISFFASSFAGAQNKSGVKDGVVGEPFAELEGAKILSEGGNAVDAIITAAATAAITSPQMCGFGGYGGHLIVSLEGGKKISSFDFNTQAPLAANPGMFIEAGKPNLEKHTFGWQSFGVPGIPAGLHHALQKHGTMPWKRALAPAIDYCLNGFKPSPQLSAALKSATRLQKDPASLKLYYSKGDATSPSTLLKNPDLYKILQAMAEDKSAEPFYKGAFAKKFASVVEQNKGILSYQDLASYKSIESAPLKLSWNDFEVFTAPLTSGGITILQTLGILKEMQLNNLPEKDRLFARIEALRFAWRDRLNLLGDPDHAKVPQSKLLSSAYQKGCGEQILDAVKNNKCMPPSRPTTTQNGTINLSAIDAGGNMAALTLTHGGYFGSQVSIEGLGITLGHGMSRFDIEPGRANSIAPGKRPLNNMAPTVVQHKFKTIAALGGRGGRRIPNAVFEVVYQMIAEKKSLEQALEAPRIHTEGNLEVYLEKGLNEQNLARLNTAGLKAKTGISAVISAVGRADENAPAVVSMR